ncbi:hypothetical protein DACRYDRAFT_15494 [Dacryopinax primogenitus]|uniref:Uncharacterized protein n=1 Tax=Dacryopinax primogenitus (strain DJM 731) TaxID=1858805 RepID=M5GE30_DACPD|nr:uncharacterized protein DACRYDRAFT_15494 [Dacryopinax primogenitus]EJU02928.1 hypothetical protein DACRYDRAFT_15494 [Dacryopinax primogenitus]
MDVHNWWSVLASAGLCWSLLVSAGLCWSLLVSAGLCWSLLAYNPDKMYARRCVRLRLDEIYRGTRYNVIQAETHYARYHLCRKCRPRQLLAAINDKSRLQAYYCSGKMKHVHREKTHGQDELDAVKGVIFASTLTKRLGLLFKIVDNNSRFLGWRGRLACFHGILENLLDPGAFLPVAPNPCGRCVLLSDMQMYEVRSSDQPSPRPKTRDGQGVGWSRKKMRLGGWDTSNMLVHTSTGPMYGPEAIRPPVAQYPPYPGDIWYHPQIDEPYKNALFGRLHKEVQIDVFE